MLNCAKSLVGNGIVGWGFAPRVLLPIGLLYLAISATAQGQESPPPPDKQTPATAPSPPPAGQPEPATQPPAPVPAPISPELDQLLDKVEQRGATLKSYQADMLFRQEQLLVDVVKIRHGGMLYQIDKDRVRFRIHFADLQTQDLDEKTPAPVVAFDEDYAFDGLWFTIRNARLKNIQRQEVSKTPAKKEEFRLGRGPFPLPFSIQKADVLKEFDVSILPPESADPKDSVHLLLKPKKDSAFADQYVQLEIWIAKLTFVPVQMRFEKDNREITSIVWSNIALDQPIELKKFEPGPAGDDWTVEQTPLPPDNPPSAGPLTPKP
jgi:hypothetical protein